MKRKRHGMKLGTKIALYTFVFGAIVGVTLTFLFSLYTRNSILTQAKLELTERAYQAAHFVDALLDSRVEVAYSIAAAKTIESAAKISTAEFGDLSDATRSITIQKLNARWLSTDATDDPFIAQYLENDAAQALTRQMEIHPGEFGEIFLTNRFGALVAATGKLTTLAHGYKPWWLAAYNKGEGAVFLDDRGYDDSVGDYVIGVVVPVMSAGEVTGILKCNFAILPAVEKAMTTSDHAADAEILLVRSNGRVVYGPGLLPLQSTISGELVTLISGTERGNAIVREGARTALAAFCAVPWTVDSTTIGSFGGTSESIDHSFGNSGESWVVVVSQDMAQVLAPASIATVRMALIAAGFIGAMVLIALILGWRISEPASKLAAQARALGSGDLAARVSIRTTDEIGELAQSFNEMADNLESTMVSRDKLADEVARRELVEGVLRESEKRYRTLFENMINGFALHEIVLNQEGEPVDYVFLEVNSAFERLTTLKRADIIGKKATEVLPGIEHDPAEWIGKYGEVALTGREVRFEQYSEVLGKWFSVLAFRTSEGQFATIFEDITERKRAEEERLAVEAQLRQSQKLESIGTLARGAAHEINNPLMGMINYAALIEDKVENETIKEYSRAIMKEGDRIATIVRNLLAFSRQGRETHSPARIKDIIDRSLSLVGSTLRKDQIKLDLDIPDDLPSVKCHSQQIQQVIINLLTNARDALNERYPGYDEDKIIRITARPFEKEGEDWIRTTIEDHGAGISEEVAQRIFDPFFTTKSRAEVSGLGLSVSFGIVKEHRGDLTVESKPGEYTRFHMDLRANSGWTSKKNQEEGA